MKKKQTKSNGPAIDSTELILAMEDLEKENGLKKEWLVTNGLGGFYNERFGNEQHPLFL